MRVPWTARRSNQSILKETSTEYPLEGLMLKLKLHYFGHLMQRTGSLEKTLILEKINGKRRRAWQMMRRLDSLTDSMDMNLSKLRETEEEDRRGQKRTEEPGMLQSMGLQRVRYALATEQQQYDPAGRKFHS